MQIWPTLFKQSKKFKEQWTILADEDSQGSFYEITFGKVDGKLQTKRNYTKGKNIGRSNETSPYQQALNEADSRWKKQHDKGYSTTGEIKILSPMLAHKFKDHEDKVQYPCAIQPKLDGQRCLALWDNGVKLISRRNKVLDIAHISEQLYQYLESHQSMVLDGEIYTHSYSFEDLSSLTKCQQEQSSILEYHIYDCITNLPFKYRIQIVNAVSGPNIKIVNTLICNNRDEVLIALDTAVKNGYEGVMIRNLNSSYLVDGRSYDLLKLKNFMDDEFEIIGAEENEHSPGQCTFLCKTKDGAVFGCKPRGSTELRQWYWQNHKSLIGKLLTVEFFEYTKTERPVPRFPVGKCIYEN